MEGRNRGERGAEKEAEHGFNATWQIRSFLCQPSRALPETNQLPAPPEALTSGDAQLPEQRAPLLACAPQHSILVSVLLWGRCCLGAALAVGLRWGHPLV